MKKPIYLDYNATTPIDPRVVDAMEPFLREHFGNPSSSHAYGQTAHDAVARARADVASLLGATPSEIIFTSGGTEATNHALKGALLPALIGPRRAAPPHLVISTVEHPATAETCAFLERLGCRLTRVPVDRYGTVDLGATCDIAHRSLPAASTTLRRLRDRLWRHLQDGLGDDIVLNGHPEQRLPNTLNVNFIGHVGAELLALVPEVAASTGSACHEGRVELSPVLRAMGVPPDIGRGAVRLSVGRFTTEAEVDRSGALLVAAARSPAPPV